LINELKNDRPESEGNPDRRTALERTVSLYFADIMGNMVRDVNEPFEN
jgi:hypothetical protein